MRAWQLPTILAALLFASPWLARADKGTAPQPADPAAKMLGAEQIRSDLQFLYETLAAGHYDLFAHRDKAAYDAFYQSLRASIDAPMPRARAAALFQQLAAYGRVGHARLDAPLVEFVAHLGSGGTLLPLFIRVDGDRVLLTRAADRAGRVPAGVELVAIAGEPIARWLERLGSYVSAERPYMAHAQMEESLPALLWLELGAVESVDATLRGPDGESVKVRIPAVTRAGLDEIGQAHPVPGIDVDFATREVRLLPQGVAYLRPGPFMNIESEQQGPSPSYEASAYRKFLDDAFRRILAARAQNLVVDLRNNPGGDNSFSDALVAWFADRPFRFASRFMLRASAPTKAWYQRLQAGGASPDPMLARLMHAEAAQPNGIRYPFEIEPTAPRTGTRFEGRVWVLVNRHSYSNATSVAALVQDYGFGTIMGEETGDVPTNYASSVHFDLPASGYSVAYPKSYFVRPSGDERLRGVVPDVPLARQPVGVAADRMLEQALAHIHNARSPGS